MKLYSLGLRPTTESKWSACPVCSVKRDTMFKTQSVWTAVANQEQCQLTDFHLSIVQTSSGKIKKEDKVNWNMEISSTSLMITLLLTSMSDLNDYPFSLSGTFRESFCRFWFQSWMVFIHNSAENSLLDLRGKKISKTEMVRVWSHKVSA